MRSVAVIILLLFCYARLSTAAGNGKVKFISRNFHNILHWDAEEPSYPDEKMLYSVEYLNYTDGEYKIKEECRSITVLSCDLTDETPSVPDAHYHARVYVNGRELGHTANRFKPIAETILGPPILSKQTTASTLYINATLPVGPKGVSVADIIKRSKNGPSKIHIIYTLKITEPKWAAMVNETETGRFVINLKNKPTEFCGHVMYRPSSEWVRSGSENAKFCVTLPGKPHMILPWLLTSIAVVVTIATVSAVWLCNYVTGGRKTKIPDPLKIIPGAPRMVLQSPDSHLTLSTPVVGSANGKTVYATIQMKPTVPTVSSGGYSPQDVPCQPWQGSAGSFGSADVQNPVPNARDGSAQLSVTYGAVAVQTPADDDEESQEATTADGGQVCTIPLTHSNERWENSEQCPQVMSLEVPHLHDPNDCDSDPAGPLLVCTVRDTHGQLLLPGFSPLSLSNTGDTDSPFHSPTTPLLMDLIDSPKEWSDSGCDDSMSSPTQQNCPSHYLPSQPDVSHYLPSQPDVSHYLPSQPDVSQPYSQQCPQTQCSEAEGELGYRQNWMPAILREAVTKDICENSGKDYQWTWSGPKIEERIDREEGRSTPIALGGWLVHFQE